MPSELWRYAKGLLDGKATSQTAPEFSTHSAHSFFSEVYKSAPHQFETPSWMPSPPSPRAWLCNGHDPGHTRGAGSSDQEVKVFISPLAFRPDFLLHPEEIPLPPACPSQPLQQSHHGGQGSFSLEGGSCQTHPQEFHQGGSIITRKLPPDRAYSGCQEISLDMTHCVPTTTSTLTFRRYSSPPSLVWRSTRLS